MRGVMYAFNVTLASEDPNMLGRTLVIIQQVVSDKFRRHENNCMSCLTQTCTTFMLVELCRRQRD